MADKGIGIQKDAKKLIFDKFYRVTTGDVHTTKGFGLGLTYAKMIVEAHGGTIDVESKLAEGSAFFIDLYWGVLFFSELGFVGFERIKKDVKCNDVSDITPVHPYI